MWPCEQAHGREGHVLRDMAPIIRCRTVVAYRQRRVINIASEPQPPQPPRPPPQPPPQPPTTHRVAAETRGLVVHRFVSCSVCHPVNLLGLPILMATPAGRPHEGGMRRREGAQSPVAGAVLLLVMCSGINLSRWKS